MKEAMWLVAHGVPFDIAFGVDAETFRLDALTRAALCIVCSEFEGRRFDFRLMRFVEDE